MKNKCAVVLCGGKGSRLGSLSKKIPKTLVKIQKKEILWYIIKFLGFSGFKHITYEHSHPNKKSFGGRVIIKMKDGSKITDEISVADAHPAGNRPFERSNYIEKFQTLTNGIITSKEAKRFLNIVQNLRKLKSGELTKLNVEVRRKSLRTRSKKTIF